MLDILCIGQSPRPELEADIGAAVPGLKHRLRGALDRLSRASPMPCSRGTARTRSTRRCLRARATASKAAVTARMRGLVQAGTGLMLPACTGAFEGLPERPGLVQLSAVLNAVAGALLPRGRLGLVGCCPSRSRRCGRSARGRSGR